MADFNGMELTGAMIREAMECKSAEELLALAEGYGISITEAEAEAYLEELSDQALDLEALENVAGGRDVCYTNGCALKCISNL